MASLIGGLFGFVLGAALVGALLAWLLRKAVPMPIVRSYAIGVFVSTVAYATFDDGLRADFGSPAGWLVAAVLGGLIAFGLLCLTSRRARGG